MSETPPLAATVRQRADGHLKVAVSGEIDILSAPQLRVTLDEALSDGVRTVEVDLSGVEFCDCYGLGVLLEARRRASERGHRSALGGRHLTPGAASPAPDRYSRGPAGDVGALTSRKVHRSERSR
ncbi:STAS domain-containing protein [Streptomyces sp. 3211.6]|uniref:STAS domain-containing protein n=1 Tax=Streptomyces sp. 3211.6 TaxID=1938845 RepID=UPI000EAFFC09